jgi:hypothetical protein
MGYLLLVKVSTFCPTIITQQHVAVSCTALLLPPSPFVILFLI